MSGACAQRLKCLEVPRQAWKPEGRFGFRNGGIRSFFPLGSASSLCSLLNESEFRHPIVPTRFNCCLAGSDHLFSKYSFKISILFRCSGTKTCRSSVANVVFDKSSSQKARGLFTPWELLASILALSPLLSLPCPGCPGCPPVLIPGQTQASVPRPLQLWWPP